jgi:3-oxoacyl-[acyl-carrier protein] reductase
VSGLIGKGGKGIKRQLPLRRFGNVEEVAALAVFLASPESGYMTGACLPVDGGGSAQLGLGRPE